MTTEVLVEYMNDVARELTTAVGSKDMSYFFEIETFEKQDSIESDFSKYFEEMIDERRIIEIEYSYQIVDTAKLNHRLEGWVYLAEEIRHNKSQSEADDIIQGFHKALSRCIKAPIYVHMEKCTYTKHGISDPIELRPREDYLMIRGDITCSVAAYGFDD